jgi:ABC-type branched-subunit amino acid transport system permease subunit
MQTFLLYALLGIGSGGIYAILSCGVVAIFKGSGVVNFAQAAIAIFAGFCYVALRNDGFPTPAAMAVVIAGAAAGGVLFAVGVMRPLRNAPALARVVTTLGLLGALTGLIPVLFPKLFGGQTNIPSIFPTNVVSILGGYLGQDRLWLAGAAVLLSASLSALYRFTTFGRATRATAENDRAAALVGFSPTVTASANWALGSGLAALAGILVIPTTGLNASVALLIVPVLAAALVGRFTSFGIVTAAAFGIASLQSLVGNYWGTQPGVQTGVPFLVVVIAMVATGRTIPARGTGELRRLPFAPPSKIYPIPLLLFSAAIVGLLFLLDPVYKGGIITSLNMAVIALSLVVVTGFVGQISLAQMMFAGGGAYLVAHFAKTWVPFPLTILVAAVLMVPAGVLLGLPALRVRGINLAIVTLGAAVAVSAIVFENPSIAGGGWGGASVPTPHLFGIDMNPNTHPEAFGTFALCTMLLVVVFLVHIRRSPFGRRMLAVRANERRAAAAGINVASLKLQAFALSAFVAAIGGGLLAYQREFVSFQQFDPMLSISLLAVVYITSIASISGGVLAGFSTIGGLWYVLLVNVGATGSWWAFISGALLIPFVIYLPDGAAVLEMRRYKRLWRKYKSRRGPGVPEPAPERSREPVLVHEAAQAQTPTKVEL